MIKNPVRVKYYSPGFQPGVSKTENDRFWRDFCPKETKIMTKLKELYINRI